MNSLAARAKICRQQWFMNWAWVKMGHLKIVMNHGSIDSETHTCLSRGWRDTIETKWHCVDDAALSKSVIHVHYAHICCALGVMPDDWQHGHWRQQNYDNKRQQREQQQQQRQKKACTQKNNGVRRKRFICHPCASRHYPHPRLGRFVCLCQAATYVERPKFPHLSSFLCGTA